MDHAQRGAKALSSSDFPAAIQEYTRALIVNPHAPDYHIKRSTAYTRLKPVDGGPKLDSALRDAEIAVALGIQRARREQILAGQMRRAIVLYQMRRYADAGFVFGIVREKVGVMPKQTAMGALGSSLTPGEAEKNTKEAGMRQELDIWELKVNNALGKLEAGDEKGVVGVKETPDVSVGDQDTLKKLYQAQLEEMTGFGKEASAIAQANTTAAAAPVAEKASNTEATKSAAPEVQKPAAQAPVPAKVRHEWYQSSDNVVVTIYAKGVPKDKAQIEIAEDSLSISFPLPTGSDFSFTLDPLYAFVDVSSSKSSVLSTKIEIVLRKKQPGQKWPVLEGTSRPTGETTASQPNTASTSQSQPGIADKAPSYPTSSRKGVKDWDKLATSLSKGKKKDGAEGGGDDDDSDYGGDPVDGFFKKLYANADPDTRRAMMKSYYESDGTALSTNWSEVGKKKVEPHPPSSD